MIRRGRFERHRRLPRLHGGKLALLIACLIQTALSVFSFAMLGKVTGALITQSAADVWRGGSDERFAQVSAFLPVNGTIDLDSIRSFRATLENAFVQNSIFAPEPDALPDDQRQHQPGDARVDVDRRPAGLVALDEVLRLVLRGLHLAAARLGLRGDLLLDGALGGAAVTLPGHVVALLDVVGHDRGYPA